MMPLSTQFRDLAHSPGTYPSSWAERILFWTKNVLTNNTIFFIV